MLTIQVPMTDMASCSPDARLAEAWRTLQANAEQRKNNYGWFNVRVDDAEKMSRLSQQLREYESVIVVGIGGSALGTQMLIRTLASTVFYPMTSEGRQPRLFVADNLDEDTNWAIWCACNAEKTALVVVSKSGRTLETLSNFLFFRMNFYDMLSDKMESADIEKHFFFVTDPEKGFLSSYARQYGTAIVDFPGDMGGRYSVLSTCALPMAQIVGIDVKELLAGAEAMRQKLTRERFTESSLYHLAKAVLESCRRGRKITVLMSYGDRLKKVGEWFAQLWGESLGKNGDGLTPVTALGSVDQHSPLQLYADGPDDKFFIVLSCTCSYSRKSRFHGVPAECRYLSVPASELFDEARYMQYMNQTQILELERQGVVASLKGRGRPVCEMRMECLDEFCLGELIFFFETLTALVGLAMGVNPFDQPCVEESKNYTLALCGHPDYQKYLDELKKLSK